MTSLADPRHHAEGIDVIVRLHDPTRLIELERAVFSLAGQHYRPLRIILATQRFVAAEVEATLATLAPIIAWSGGVEIAHVNLTGTEPADARSVLVNMGFAAATGRYVALLDYDDVLYPEAYELLIGRLRASGAGIAFARTPVALTDLHEAFVCLHGQSHKYAGHNLGDLLRSNFCPIHSFVIDRTLAPEGTLRFEPMLTIEEDYEFLIRLCAVVRADFTLANTDVGLYFFKTDGSNTFPRLAEIPESVGERIAAARAFVEARKELTVLSPEVQRDLGMAQPVAGLTVRRWLDRHREPRP